MNQTDDVARANGSLTVLKAIDDLEPDERALLDQDRQELAAELKAAAAYEAAEREKQRLAALAQRSGGVSVWDRWTPEKQAAWQRSAARSGMLPSRLPVRQREEAFDGYGNEMPYLPEAV